jgi:hypothetical protein
MASHADIFVGLFQFTGLLLLDAGVAARAGIGAFSPRASGPSCRSGSVLARVFQFRLSVSASSVEVR